MLLSDVGSRPGIKMWKATTRPRRPPDFRLLLADRYGASSGNANPDLMSLEGRRLITAAETKQGRRLDEGKLKWITGGDMIHGRALYQEEREFHPSHTLWITANDSPVAKDDDDGLWTRVHRIPAGVEQRHAS
jgi:hypothetical protein